MYHASQYEVILLYHYAFVFTIDTHNQTLIIKRLIASILRLERVLTKTIYQITAGSLLRLIQTLYFSGNSTQPSISNDQM